MIKIKINYFAGFKFVSFPLVVDKNCQQDNFKLIQEFSNYGLEAKYCPPTTFIRHSLVFLVPFSF